MSSNKRAKVEAQASNPTAEAEGVKVNICQLLESDLKQIAAMGRHDGKMLSKLQAFASNLDRELDEVKGMRDKEIAVASQEKSKQEKATSKGCSKCKLKEKVDNFRFCACFSKRHWFGDSGRYGAILCESCFEKEKGKLKSCSKCDSFLCKKCSGYSKECGNKGGGCEKIFCSTCEESEKPSFDCDCGNWFCSSCVDDNKKTRKCYNSHCNKIDRVCIRCDEEQEYCDGCNDDHYSGGLHEGGHYRDHSFSGSFF